MVLPNLSRRVFLAGSAAALLSRPAGAQASAIHSAAAFVDSVGVNTHLSSEPYASRFELVRDLLAGARIRHIRDELRPHTALDRLRELFERHGVRSNLLVSPATNTVRQMLDYLDALGPEKVSAIEGQNEGDSDWFRSQKAASGDWSAAVIAYQREVFEALRPRYPEAVLPILSPTVLDWKPEDADAIRAAAKFCDIVAIHSYAQHGEEPETDAPYSALSWYLRNIRDRLKPGAPAMATETGYNNLIHMAGAGISEAAAAAYIPRLLLFNFAAGIKRTFLYELLDEGTNLADMEQHWGLVRYDGTPKPAYHALAALLGALSEGEGGPPPALAPASALLRNAPADARMLQFHKADGSTIAAVWRAVRCWDPASGRDIPVEPMPLTIAIERTASSASFAMPAERGENAAWMELPAVKPEGGAAWTDLPVSGAAITVPAGAKVVLVRLA